MIRYRTGIDRNTGKPLRGWAHVQQSIATILRTLPGERWMLLDFGSNMVGHLGRNMVPAEILAIYQDVVPAIHAWEPEFRIARLALVQVERTGTLGLGVAGTYYPEGRLGNYAIAEAVSAAFPVAASSVGAAA
jgi:phage baseplate assembly protein W